MASTYKLPYTALEIAEKLSKSVTYFDILLDEGLVPIQTQFQIIDAYNSGHQLRCVVPTSSGPVTAALVSADRVDEDQFLTFSGTISFEEETLPQTVTVRLVIQSDGMTSEVKWETLASKTYVNDTVAAARKYNGWIDTLTGVYIDTKEKTLTFGQNTYITYGNQLLNVSNTVHDISDLIGGSWVFLDYSKTPYTLTKDRTANHTVLLGALWSPANLADLHMDKSKLFIDGVSAQSSRAVEVDNTLSRSGAAADAKAVGDKVEVLRKYHNGWIDTNTGVYIDTTAKTLTFGANTYITYGSQLFNMSNTTHDISTMISGAWVYLDYSKQPYTLIKDRNTQYTVLLGALWKPNHLADLHMDKTKLYVDGMPVTYIGRFNGKTINCLGDSMTEGVGTTKAYHQWFGQLCGFKTINNYGLGGSCIAPKVDAVPTWESGIESFYERYDDMADADVVTVFGCVNDWTTGRELGAIGDTTTDTFYGAMKALCEGLIAKYPSGNIYVFSSPQCDYINRPANDLAGTAWAGNTEGYNRKGYKLQDYANAMAEVCAIYGIPFCSLTNNLFYGLSGVLGDHKGTSGVFGSDALHPNEVGHKKLAIRMADFINSGSGNAYFPTEPMATKSYVDNAIANLPSGGSAIPKAMELIASGTNTEPVRRFKITADNEGKPFELTKMYLVVRNLVSNNTDGNQGITIAIQNTTTGLDASLIAVALMTNEAKNKDVVAYANEDGLFQAFQGGGGIYSLGAPKFSTVFMPNQTFTVVNFTCASATQTFQTGATYELWGVRK